MLLFIIIMHRFWERKCACLMGSFISKEGFPIKCISKANICLSCFFLYFILPKPMKLEDCFDQYFIWKNRLLTPSSIDLINLNLLWGEGEETGRGTVGMGVTKALLLSDFFLQIPRLWEGAPISSSRDANPKSLALPSVLLAFFAASLDASSYVGLHSGNGRIGFPPPLSLARVHFSGLIIDWVPNAASTSAEKYFANC